MWVSTYGNFNGQGSCNLAIYRDWNNGGVYMCYPTADTILDTTVDYASAMGHHYMDGSYYNSAANGMYNCQAVDASGSSLSFYSGNPQYVLGDHYARNEYTRWVWLPPHYETYDDTLSFPSRWN